MKPSEHRLRITNAIELRQLLTLPAPSAVVLDVVSMRSDEAATWERESGAPEIMPQCSHATIERMPHISSSAAVPSSHPGMRVAASV